MRGWRLWRATLRAVPVFAVAPRPGFQPGGSAASSSLPGGGPFGRPDPIVEPLACDRSAAGTGSRGREVEAGGEPLERHGAPALRHHAVAERAVARDHEDPRRPRLRPARASRPRRRGRGSCRRPSASRSSARACSGRAGRTGPGPCRRTRGRWRSDGIAPRIRPTTVAAGAGRPVLAPSRYRRFVPSTMTRSVPSSGVYRGPARHWVTVASARAAARRPRWRRLPRVRGRAGRRARAGRSGGPRRHGRVRHQQRDALPRRLPAAARRARGAGRAGSRRDVRARERPLRARPHAERAARDGGRRLGTRAGAARGGVRGRQRLPRRDADEPGGDRRLGRGGPPRCRGRRARPAADVPQDRGGGRLRARRRGAGRDQQGRALSDRAGVPARRGRGGRGDRDGVPDDRAGHDREARAVPARGGGAARRASRRGAP